MNVHVLTLQRIRLTALAGLQRNQMSRPAVRTVKQVHPLSIRQHRDDGWINQNPLPLRT